MEFVIDLLSDDEQTRLKSARMLKQQPARKTGKHERIKKLLDNIAEVQAAPVVDFLAAMGD